MRKLSEKEKQFYNKIRIFASIEDSKVQEKNLTNDDIFEICKYSDW